MATTDVTTTIPPPRSTRCLATLPTEIAELVLENLSQPSLAACATVNKAWHTLCIPFLWRTVAISTPQDLHSFMSVESQRALHRNAAHIRGLYLWYSSAYKIFSPLDHAYTPQCNSLLSLYISRYKDPTYNPMTGQWNDHNEHWGRPLDSASESAVADLIRRNPGLKKLKVAKCMSPQTLIPLLTHDLPNLQVLVLDDFYGAYNQCITKVLLEHLPESIQSITLTMGLGKPARCAAAAGTLQKQLGWKKNKTPPRQHHALESLNLDCWHFFPDYLALLVPFLNSCSSKLCTIHIPRLDWFHERQVREVLTRLGYALRRITQSDVPCHSPCMDALFTEYVCLSNQWKTINFSHCTAVGPLTIQAISEHCEHLQYLNIDCCRNVSSAELNAILAKALCLKTFLAMYCNAPVHRDDPFLFTQDFIALDWGSLVLEDFHCRIIVSESDRHWDDDDHEEEKESLTHDVVVTSRHIQRQVYRKLAEQRSLKSLCLGSYL